MLYMIPAVNSVAMATVRGKCCVYEKRLVLCEIFVFARRFSGMFGSPQVVWSLSAATLTVDRLP